MANREDPAVRLMGMAEVMERLGVSRQRVGHLIERPDFPRPLAVLKAGRIWNADDIEVWITEHQPWKSGE
nr:AlpA family phage regulatory protein [Micromonospora sp. DSM 115978]